MRALAAGLVVAVALASPARAQDRFEIQVYDVETAAPAEVGIELHLNAVAQGTTQSSEAGELPTNHVGHVTMEPHVGLWPGGELGMYLQAAVRPDGEIDFAGAKVRLKARVPKRLGHGLLGLALNVELSYVPAGYEANVYGSELRPIIDLRWRRLYVSVNPIVGIDLAGADAGRPQFEPAAKVAIDVGAAVSVGAEYFGAIGPIASPLALSSQTHWLFAAVDWLRKLSPRADLAVNAGVGYDLGGGAERWVVKAIVGVGH